MADRTAGLLNNARTQSKAKIGLEYNNYGYYDRLSSISNSHKMEQNFECLIDYHFRDRVFIEEALEEVGPESAGNERLALLGDTILSLMLLRRWYCEGNTTGRYAPVIADIALIPRRARHERGSRLRLQ